MELPLVEPLPLARGERAEPVRVVRHEEDSAVTGSSSTVKCSGRGVAEEDPERAEPRERLAPAAVALAAVDESGVEAERDVVEEAPLAGQARVHAALDAVEARQGGERVVAVEAEVAGEVVPRAERHHHEGEVALDRHARDGAERAVAAGHAQRIGVRATGELDEVVVGLRARAPRRRGRAPLPRGPRRWGGPSRSAG